MKTDNHFRTQSQKRLCFLVSRLRNDGEPRSRGDLLAQKKSRDLM
jgi:hypothetical protein